jgi:hypothetical protein
LNKNSFKINNKDKEEVNGMLTFFKISWVFTMKGWLHPSFIIAKMRVFQMRAKLVHELRAGSGE